MPELQKQVQQGDLILSKISGIQFGHLIRVRISDDTRDLLRKVRKASDRPFVGIICAAIQNYLQDPSYYKPHIIHPTEKLTTIVNVRVSRKAADFLLDEAFIAPVRSRQQLIGLIVGTFLRRYSFKNVVTALHAYADVIGPMLRGGLHDKRKSGK